MTSVAAGTKTVPMVTGNPLSYRGKTLTWQNGRELESVDGATTYAYGADGLRTAKTVSGVTTTYTLSGSTVLSQTTGNVTLFFYYDANGRLTQIGYKNGASAEVFYFVTHNLQGGGHGVGVQPGTVLSSQGWDKRTAPGIITYQRLLERRCLSIWVLHTRIRKKKNRESRR